MCYYIAQKVIPCVIFQSKVSPEEARKNIWLVDIDVIPVSPLPFPCIDKRGIN